MKLSKLWDEFLYKFNLVKTIVEIIPIDEIPPFASYLYNTIYGPANKLYVIKQTCFGREYDNTGNIKCIMEQIHAERKRW